MAGTAGVASGLLQQPWPSQPEDGLRETGGQRAAVSERIIPLGTNDGVVTWLYYMRRLVFELKLAVHVPGTASLGVNNPYLPGGYVNAAALEANLLGDPTIDWDSSAFDHPKTLGQYREALRRVGRPRDPVKA